MYRIVTTGGRSFDDYDLVMRAMNEERILIQNEIVVFNGDCTGADQLVNVWCETNGVHRFNVPALWRVKGPAAGPIRNRVMLDVAMPTIVIAFPGGAGTESCISEAKKRGLRIRKIDYTTGFITESFG